MQFVQQDAVRELLAICEFDAAGCAEGKPIAFRVGPTSKVWKGRGFGTLADVAAGQTVQVNLTVCTLNPDISSAPRRRCHIRKINMFLRIPGRRAWAPALPRTLPP